MPASNAAKHKEKNKHRFLTFSERLALVSVDAVHRIRRVENSEDEECNFQASLVKWRDQDRSQRFQEFYAEIVNQSRNFKMIVHYKDEIVAVVLKHLDIPDSLALQALCEILVSLCMDLRSDFYPYFGEFFRVLTKLLHTKEVERLEWIFSALSLMFKYLWKYMVSDIDNILNMYQNLICGDHPEHIESFAAESVTFLIRKACCRDGFFKKFFLIYKDIPMEQSIGKILYHLLKGVSETLYSRTESLMPNLLQCIGSPDLDARAVSDCLKYALTLLSKHVKRAKSRMMWDALTCYLQEASASATTLNYAIELMVTWILEKNGAMILDEEKISDIFESINDQYAGKYSESIINLCVALVSAKSDYFDQNYKDRIVTSLMRSKGHPICLVIKNFWHKILNHVDSNNVFRRLMLNFCQIEIANFPIDIVQLLVDFVLENSSLPVDAKELLNYQPFNIDYALISRDKGVKKMQESLKDIISCADADPSMVWCCLLLMSHISPVPSKIFEVLSELFAKLTSQIFGAELKKRRVFAVMRMLFQTGYLLHKKSAPKTKANFTKLCQIMEEFLMEDGKNELSKDPNTLFLLDILCLLDEDVVKKSERNSGLIQNLIPNLSSPNAVIRKFSLRILVSLQPAEALFKICLKVEETPATLQSYRDKVLHLSKIENPFDMDTQIQLAALRYLLSNYYVNFTPYWNHVHEKISSFLPNDGKSELWVLLFDLLKAASGEITENQYEMDCETSVGLQNTFFENGVNVTLTTGANMKPDFFNYRYLFWVLLQNIPHSEIIERNNRHLVMPFFEFLEKEYCLADKSNSASQNLLARDSDGTHVKPSLSKKNCLKLLVGILKVFAKLNNPKGCFMTDKLKTTYEDFLMHGNLDVQKWSLKCYLKFKNKHLAGFFDLLHSLLDEHKIKETILEFKLDEVEDEKRRALIPILFRIMYGKITSSSSSSSESGKTRSLLLRFLSSLRKDEMDDFVMLAIAPIKYLVDETKMSTPLDENFDLNVDLRRVVPLSKQSGILNTLTELIEKHPGVISERMFHYLLRLLLTLHLSFFKMIHVIESSKLETASETTTSFLRTLAKQGHNAINLLISVWPETLSLSYCEIRSIFYVLIDPHAHKMQHECISHSNMTLKLCDEFSKQQKFIPLLGNRILPSQSCLVNEMTQTLVSPKTSNHVASFILQILVRLIQDEQDDEMDPSVNRDLIIETLSSIESDIIDSDSDPSLVGLLLMVGQVTNIFKYFINKLKEKNGSGLIQSHLQILIALGHHINDADLSNELVELLLGHISNVARAGRDVSASAEEKLILPALESLNAIPISQKFILPISRLYSRVTSRECRLSLGKVFEKAVAEIVNASTENSMFSQIASIVSDLNAWDKRFIEELDYDSRLAGFQQLIDMLKSDEAKTLLDNQCLGLSPLLHNCIFTLAKHGNDLSLREMSSQALELILGMVFGADQEKYPGILDVIVTATILPALRRGLSSNDEVQRHEWLRLLVKLAKISPPDNSFSSLKVLCNDNDPDADFFLNVQHIQMHRRTRAYRKLAEVISATSTNDHDGHGISHTLVSTYLVPLATQTLKSQDLSKHLHLRDACLEVVSACAAVMPWSAYIKLLRYNITMMRRQAFGVKMVCAILDSFHFDVASIPTDKAIALESSHFLIKAKKKNKQDDDSNTDHPDSDKEEENIDELKDEISSIYKVTVCDILPRLCNSLSTKLGSDINHKLADSTSFSDIDMCSARAPLAIAIVMLLKKLPVRVLNKNLPTVILKIVMFLRHHYSEVRTAASKVMVEIVEVLQPSYLPIVLREMKDGLMRGYQKHVLLHTMHCIFSKIEPTLKIGELEPSKKILLNILKDDLFGKGEEERGVEKIKSKLPEARGRSKAYNLFKIYAKFSRKDSILDAIAPLKTILDTTHDHNKRKIVECVLNEINHGLQENSNLSGEDIMIFLHGLLTESMPGIYTGTSSKQQTKKGFRPKSCYLLSTEPERYGVKDTKKSQKTNLHLLIEFALQFFNSALKRRVIEPNNEKHMGMLDPFVTILKQCLASAHSKITAEATRCLTRLLRLELPSLDVNAVEIINALFKILRENSQGATHNDIAAATYKALSVVCKGDIGSKLSDTQLQVLLGYAEEMLYDQDRQSHAFNVIQSIISRGLVCDEMNDVMEKIRNICIQSHDTAAMAHARQVYVYYVTHYPMKKTVWMKHLQFVLAQLSFEFESGRISALEMLGSLLEAFTKGMIKASSTIIFVPLSAMLVNEESVKCKKLCAYILKLLLAKLEVEDKDQLFDLVLQW